MHISIIEKVGIVIDVILIIMVFVRIAMYFAKG